MRFPMIAVSAVAVVIATAAAAQAAPQAMMLVAGGENLQFRCTGEECLAEATSICLQAERSTPLAGTPYELVDEERYGTGRANGLDLVGIASSGEAKSLPLETMQIVAEREHMAVRFIVGRAVFAANAIERLELRVAHNVVLAPVWKPGDAHPLMDDELELVMGPMRATAENVLRQREERVASARVLGDLLNDLPRDRVASVAERVAVYQQVLASRVEEKGKPLPADAIAGAQAALNVCSDIRDEEMWYQAFNTRISRYRACIGFQHDKLIKNVNETYWDTVKTPGM
jgi:hypothetical protein